MGVLTAKKAHWKCETIWLSHKSLGLFITGVFVVARIQSGTLVLLFKILRLEIWYHFEDWYLCSRDRDFTRCWCCISYLLWMCWLKIWKLKLFLRFWASILRLILDVNFTPDKVWIKTCCTGKHKNVGPRCLMKLTANGNGNLQRSSPNGSGWGFIPGHTLTNWVS